MSFGVFIHRTDSIYEDSPAERYQFPAQYLGRAQACVGDWILYYEPVKVTATRGYFAMARVQAIIPDPSDPRMYVALIEPGSYLEFARTVAFSGPEGVIERGLLNAEQRISGRAQSAIRGISASDFDRILEAGLSDEADLLPRDPDPLTDGDHVRDDRSPFGIDEERARIFAYTSRIARDRAFRKLVLTSYGERCAITGLRIINGGGRAEAQAAHIQPVYANGPDSISNGIALSGTVHWMFDRGLIGLDDDLRILVSRHANDAASVCALINGSGLALAPARAVDRPHPRYIRWHREHCFKR